MEFSSTKKKLILFAVILLLISLLLVTVVILMIKDSKNGVAAKIGDEIITNQQVENNLNIQKENIETNSRLSSEEKEQLLSNLSQPTESNTVNRLIRQELIMKDAERIGIHVSEEEAKQELTKTLNLILEGIESSDETERLNYQQTYRFRQEEIKKTGLSEEEYMKKYEIPNQVLVMTMNKHYQYYCDHIFPEEKDGMSEETGYYQYLAALEKEFHVVK